MHLVYYQRACYLYLHKNILSFSYSFFALKLLCASVLAVQVSFKRTDLLIVFFFALKLLCASVLAVQVSFKRTGRLIVFFFALKFLLSYRQIGHCFHF